MPVPRRNTDVVAAPDLLPGPQLVVVVADWDCKTETGYAEAEYEATMRLQEEFVETHKAELEALVLDAG